jgi:predicted DNA-binding transcriptional regulator YafY
MAQRVVFLPPVTLTDEEAGALLRVLDAAERLGVPILASDAAALREVRTKLMVARKLTAGRG